MRQTLSCLTTNNEEGGLSPNSSGKPQITKLPEGCGWLSKEPD